jgi:hypothetical protein
MSLAVLKPAVVRQSSGLAEYSETCLMRIVWVYLPDFYVRAELWTV